MAALVAARENAGLSQRELAKLPMTTYKPVGFHRNRGLSVN